MEIIIKKERSHLAKSERTKKRFTKIVLPALICLSASIVHAQDASKYHLMPYLAIVPVGNKVDLHLFWDDKNYNSHEGANPIMKGNPPIWTINGLPSTVANKNNGSISSGLSMAHATYTAPDKVPSVNPVTVTVKFRANDSTTQEVTLICQITVVDLGKVWYFAYTGARSSEKTIKTPDREFVRRENVSGAASMMIDAMPPQDGYVNISTEQGDKVLSASVSGYCNYYESDIQRFQGQIEEKTIRKYAGIPDRNNQGLLFEYNAKDKTDQQGIQAAGLSFKGSGTDEFWKPKTGTLGLEKSVSKDSGLNLSGIGLGQRGDKVTKTKNGFAIDFQQSKDTTYHVLNEVHTEQVVEKYHAVLIRINKKY